MTEASGVGGHIGWLGDCGLPVAMVPVLVFSTSVFNHTRHRNPIKIVSPGSPTGMLLTIQIGSGWIGYELWGEGKGGSECGGELE